MTKYVTNSFYTNLMTLDVIRLHHHPFSRASTVVWMLEEVAVDYELAFVDIMAGEQKADAFVAKNPMGKLPTLEAGDLVVTETAAIGLYLADRYGGGALAPALDSPDRGTYYRWSLFAPSVIEPGATAKSFGWEYREDTVGWGNFDAMLGAMETAVGTGDFLLGDAFSMADVIFGSTLRLLLQFKMVEPRAAFTSYIERLEKRPALQRADAKNAAIAAERGLGK